MRALNKYYIKIDKAKFVLATSRVRELDLPVSLVAGAHRQDGVPLAPITDKSTALSAAEWSDFLMTEKESDVFKSVYKKYFSKVYRPNLSTLCVRPQIASTILQNNM